MGSTCVMARLRSKWFRFGVGRGVCLLIGVIFSRPSEWVISEESKPVQEQLWRELTAKLEGIHPGILGNL